jgi:hypothetical protein
MRVSEQNAAWKPELIQPSFGYGYAVVNVRNGDDGKPHDVCLRAVWRPTKLNTKATSGYTSPESCVYDLKWGEIREVKMLVVCDPENDWASCDPVQCQDAPYTAENGADRGRQEKWCDTSIEVVNTVEAR